MSGGPVPRSKVCSSEASIRFGATLPLMFRTIDNYSMRGTCPAEFQSLNEYVSNVPLLEKEDVRSGALLSERPRPGKWKHTGGSTGIPLAIYRENDLALKMTCCQYRSRALWGVGIFDRSVMLWGHGSSYSPSLSGLRQTIEDSLRDRVRFSSYRLGKEDLRRYLDEMEHFKPAFLYGYSSAVYLLALEALKIGVNVPSLKLIVLTAEILTREIRETVKRAFHTNVVEEYGAAECELIACEDPLQLLRAREDLVMVETLPTQGSYYEIVISVLDNPSFPLLRYNIGDLTDRSDH